MQVRWPALLDEYDAQFDEEAPDGLGMMGAQHVTADTSFAHGIIWALCAIACGLMLGGLFAIVGV